MSEMYFCFCFCLQIILHDFISMFYINYVSAMLIFIDDTVIQL